MVTPYDPTWYSDVEPPEIVEDPSAGPWDEEADVVVVGFGGAGACAAIEAADHGAKVLIVDRFQGGGATTESGGVYYAGGGTPYQKQAGVEDTPEEMVRYLSLETRGVVKEATLRKFCADSVSDLAWLEQQGVPFEASLCPYKTSYPINRYRLYFSGNEAVPRFARAARPAARGHVASGEKGFRAVAGPAFFQPLRASAERKGVTTRLQSRAKRLIVDPQGAVAGLIVHQIPPDTFCARLHRWLAAADVKVHRFVPALGKLARKGLQRIEKRKTVPRRIRAHRGVILSAGGFVFNRRMIGLYAPKYLAGMALGTAGDDGSGIRLGQSAGGAVGSMDRVSAWRFVNPPSAWARGIIVNGQGERYCDETVYGALLGEAMCEEQGGKAILIIDRSLFREALRQILPWKVMMFQLMAAASNMFFNARKGRTLEDLARILRIPSEKLIDTVDTYNRTAAGRIPDPFEKPGEYIQALVRQPYYAMDVSLNSPLYPCPTITFGGLLVDEASGQVKRDDGSGIPGLYAAGRTAVGIASSSYVSGLSIADCVFSGRRAGRHAAGNRDGVPFA
jgi:3-oxo-5alpha-steroid 4-dehydrogenase